MTVLELASRITTLELAWWDERFRKEGEHFDQLARGPKKSHEGITAAATLTLARR